MKRLFIQRGQLTIAMGFPPLLGGEGCGVGMSPGHLKVRLVQQVRPRGMAGLRFDSVRAVATLQICV